MRTATSGAQSCRVTGPRENLRDELEASWAGIDILQCLPGPLPVGFLSVLGETIR
jgi:hypothetical protein